MSVTSIVGAKVNGIHRLAFFVDGKPVPKQAFRSIRGHVTRPVNVKAWQDVVGWTAQIAMRALGRIDPLAGPLEVELHFALFNRRPMDLDNLSKAVLDGMNRVVWQDDRQIVDLHITKSIDAEHPGVQVLVRERKVDVGNDS
jgi:Holliday junction resolvase RusA-like endonuclease